MTAAWEELAMSQESSDPIREVEEQLAAVFANGRAYVRRLAKRIHPDLVPSGYHLLRMLENHGPSRPSAIAEYMEMDRSAVSRLIQLLEGMGLIERTPDLEDRRAQVMTLTADARERLALLRSRQEGPVRKALQTWDKADLVKFAEYLVRLDDEMGG